MILATDAEFAALSGLAERVAGLHLPAGKRAFVASRLQKRLRCHDMADFGAYLRLLAGDGKSSAAERLAFVSALTTNVTDVYREPHHFALLAEHLALWRAERPHDGDRYRVWSAGCASGEEPLSIAATCRAILGPGWTDHVRILATDVDEVILSRARSRHAEPGVERRLQALPPGVAAIARHGPLAAIDPIADLQSGIAYVHHNLMDPLPAPGAFDAIFCRNVTIYFSADAQRAVHARLRARLAPGALLAIGHSERLLGSGPGLTPVGATAFRCVAAAWRIAAGAAR